MVEALPRDRRGLRDRALLMIGFSAGMRRSELAGLDIEDVVDEPEGWASRSGGRRPTRRARVVWSASSAGAEVGSPTRSPPCATGVRGLDRRLAVPGGGRTTGHRSEAIVRRYIREGSKFLESASRYLLAR
jgi:hypothetical protein